MRLDLRYVAIGGACLLLAGCGTPEYRAAWDDCRERSLRAFPPDFERVRVARDRYDPVKDTRCTPLPDGRKSCFTTSHTGYAPPVEFRTVDRNERRREEMTWQCVRDACVASHGNPECKS